MKKNIIIKKSQLYIWNGIGYQKLNYADILWIEKNAGKVRIATEKQDFWINMTLQHVKDLIPYEHLQRVHRSYIINTQQVNTIIQRKVYINQKEIPVGKSFWKDFIESHILMR